MREQRLIERIKLLTDSYSFKEPFAAYLQNYFRVHPEMGSRDRRMTREWCFNFLRIGKNLKQIPFEERLSVANFLCFQQAAPENTFLQKTYKGFDDELIESSLSEKIKIVQEKYSFSINSIFNLNDELSDEINIDEWNKSFLIKPLVWIRIRKKFLTVVLEELKKENIIYATDTNELLISFQPDVNLRNLDSFQKGYFEIQDRSSQATGDFFTPRDHEIWWDCCAGAGGKSLLLKEKNASVEILATDIRENILTNYRQRMSRAHHRNYVTKEIDLNEDMISGEKFDGIIADVPCTGSGTWSRSPEWLHADVKNKITDFYVPLQQSIITNVVQNLKSGFPLIYITCSVFSKENEDNVRFFHEQLPLKLENSIYIKGYNSRADTLFVARFLKL